jgi:hypothetical protein
VSVCVVVVRWVVSLLFFKGLHSVKVCAEAMPAQAKAMAAVVKTFVSIAAVVSVCMLCVCVAYIYIRVVVK